MEAPLCCCFKETKELKISEQKIFKWVDQAITHDQSGAKLLIGYLQDLVLARTNDMVLTEADLYLT